MPTILPALALILFVSGARATPIDISSKIRSFRCQIPSEDQRGAASLMIHEAHGSRTMILALEYSEFAKWKMITFPIAQVTAETSDGSIAMQIQYKSGYEGNVLIEKDMNGVFNMKSPGINQVIPMTNCQVQL